MNQLDDDIVGPYTRVKDRLAKDFGEEYALRVIFTMLTAEHLHRAWNMTPLTHKVLKKLCKTFGLRMTWELGVLRGGRLPGEAAPPEGPVRGRLNALQPSPATFLKPRNPDLGGKINVKHCLALLTV